MSRYAFGYHTMTLVAVQSVEYFKQVLAAAVYNQMERC